MMVLNDDGIQVSNVIVYMFVLVCVYLCVCVVIIVSISLWVLIDVSVSFITCQILERPIPFLPYRHNPKNSHCCHES